MLFHLLKINVVICSIFLSLTIQINCTVTFLSLYFILIQKRYSSFWFYFPSTANFFLSKTKEKGLLARELIRACNDILENRSKKGAYIYGATGTGKTFLLGCVYNYLKRNGKQPAIIYYPEFIRKIKSRISNNDYTEYVDIIRTQEILLIDDIGAENTTDFIRDEILGPIINYREAEKLPTFFTSNLSYDDLLEFVSTSNNKVDYTKAVRIVDRIKSLTNPFFLDGENEREYY